ncbi:MAG TPA: radical SAM protein [Methylomusa anaerophila]|uniref:Biotin synthase n=1 Tax=Methylomusa anaerophila TaxID=1930071 RepID=A0A348AEX3_9FIRM|nr:radical SAM protein [Methylomusa anaerophila]BBB89621.1 biotin synthase [Methylomusa anaerophila]HML89606.1 radical SAM protein [Methylomusa anaerophila]
MSITTVKKNEMDNYNGDISQEAIKKALYQELELKIELFVEGISFKADDVKQFEIGTKYQEQIHILFDMDKAHHSGFLLPAIFYLPHGLRVNFRWDPQSKYRLVAENGRPVIYKQQERIAEIEFYKRPELLDYKTSDGEPFGHIAAFIPEGGVGVCYSNECALKETDEDCLYCNINSTAGAYSQENIFIKTPRQVAEVVAAAYKQGRGNHVNVTGGFIPERRELDYYADVAEEIKELTGLDDFNGTAVIGAPVDYRGVEKYKEAGYRTIALNIEIWEENIFKAICPGKEKRCGGRTNWVKALEYAAEVFGKGKVRSNIVAGIEPKQSILEGVEYLASKGVICFAGAWCPNPGSKLEGHRTPETAWHFDLTKKAAAIHRKYGFTIDQLYDCSANSTAIHDAYRIETEQFEGLQLSQYKFPQL